MSSFAPVAKTSDIPTGRGKAFTVNGKRIAVFNDGENFYALDNTCAHALGSLGRGRIKNGLAICPEDLPSKAAGETVRIIMLDWNEEVDL